MTATMRLTLVLLACSAAAHAQHDLAGADRTPPTDDASAVEPDAPAKTKEEAEAKLIKLLNQHADLMTGTCSPDEIAEEVDETVFVASPSGVVRPPKTAPQITERTPVRVMLVSPKELKSYVNVYRSSATRDPNRVSYFGTDKVAKFTLDESFSTSCDTVSFSLGDFAPGEGTIKVEVISGSAKLTTGTFNFPVMATHAGAAVFGPVYSWMHDRSYQLVPEDPEAAGDDARTVLSVSDERQLRYVAGVSVFLTGPRAVDGGRWDPHLGLFLGVDVQEPLENGYLGLNLSLNGIASVNAGMHAGRVSRLAPGLDVGPEGVLLLNDGAVPTTSVWKAKPYLGFTIDARAAVAAFSSSIRDLVR